MTDLKWFTTADKDGDCAIFDGDRKLIGVGATPKQTTAIVGAHNKIFEPVPELSGTCPLILYFANEADREQVITAVESRPGIKVRKRA